MRWTGRNGLNARRSFTRGAVSTTARWTSSRHWENLPAGPSLGDLTFSPKWDDLRGDARFEKIVAAVAAPLKIE